MADEDEIDVLGEFSFNSCLAQNNQGIPSCSGREDTVHPQWLLDSTANNWYDKGKEYARTKTSPRSPRLLKTKNTNFVQTHWRKHERQILVREMEKYGCNSKKIAETLKSKTEAQIQLIIDSEYGVHLDSPCIGLLKSEDYQETPPVVQEEIVTDGSHLDKTISQKTTKLKEQLHTKFSPYSLLKSNVLTEIKTADAISNSAEVFYEDDIAIGSMELIGNDEPNISLEIKPNNKKGMSKTKGKILKHGNHRRKRNKSYEKVTYKNKDVKKSPYRRQKSDSLSLEESINSPKMQIVLGSGKALPLSEGEKVIKIEKQKNSDSDSEIDIDIDSEDESNQSKRTDSIRSISESDYNSATDVPNTPENITNNGVIRTETSTVDVKQDSIKEEPIAVPLRKIISQPRRQKKINLDGGGGYTITHTEAGDLCEYGAEPKRERQPRKQTVELIQCRFYNKDKPAPYSVELGVSTLLCMDCHAHSSRAEVMGLVGGSRGTGGILLSAYRPVAALSSTTHCDMDPVSQLVAASSLESLGMSVVCWHHSHPTFPATPSHQDVTSQRAMQLAFERADSPMLAIITSQLRATGRTATHFRCFRVECTEDGEDAGYQLSVKLVPDVSFQTVPSLVDELGVLLRADEGPLAVDVLNDVCPYSGTTYLEKCISSINHHMRSAGYEEGDPVVTHLVQSLRDVFR